MADDFKYDVFISYSHKDEEWADKVLRQRLDDAGLKVCIDYRDFEAGKMALLNMQDVAKESKHVVLVITRNWLNSEWSLFEALMGGTQDPAGLQKKLIPLLCEDGIQKDINPFIAMRTWVDFTRKDREEIAWKQLSDAIGKPATFDIRPATEKWFFGHRYGDIENFTGRTAELKMLSDWLDNDKDNLLVLRALGGFGKSILTWQWFNNSVDKTKWQTAVWWSFYEKESGFESFLSETLKHLGVEVKQSTRQQVNDLLEAMRGTNILIVLDGFERLLRQYGKMDAALQSDDEDVDIDPSQRDCSSPLTETFLRGLSGSNMRSKVLMTTRLCPRALESADGKLLKGCRDESLSAFSPEDAVTYFHNEGIAATRAEIIAVCSAYGYHPLSLSLLVGLINEDHEHRGDIEAVKNLEIFEDVRARRHHVLEHAYESLAPERRDLLSKISCFRGSMEYAVLKKVFPSPDLDKALLDLRKRGLLQYAGETGRYDLHSIVRHYAYDHFTDEKRTRTHEQLFTYFEAILKPEKINLLEDLSPVIEFYYHTARAGRFEDAATIYYKQLQDSIYFQFGSYQLGMELLTLLFSDGDDKPPTINRSDIQEWALNELGRLYARIGQPHKSILLREIHNDLVGGRKISLFNERTNLENKVVLSTGMANLANVELSVGKLKASENHLRYSITLVEELNFDYMRRSQFGNLLSYCGLWSDAEQELAIAREWFEKTEQEFATSASQEDKDANYQLQALNWSYISFYFLLKCREDFTSYNLKSAVNSAFRALELAHKDKKPVPHDLMFIHWLLGTTIHAGGNLTEAEKNLDEALRICRSINAIDHEAMILVDIARLRFHQQNYEEAKTLANEALNITERCGYILQGADVNLFLAQYALEQEKDKVKAKEYAESALKLAYCDGPPYYYKVAYDEAENMLERLK